jgi:hypothetical protein
MAEKYGPFNSGTGAAFDETQWREWLANLFSPGVVKGAKVAGSAGGDLATTVVGGNMNVSIATGCGFVYGFAYENDAATVKTIGTQGGGLNRIDYVVLKLDFVARTVLIAVKVGTAASSPAAPSLTQSATVWEVPLCQVFVGNGVAALVSGNLTDSRAYCTALVNPVMGSGSGLDADLLDGKTSGHSTGQIPISDGTLNTNLNAAQTGGHSATHAAGGLAINDGTLNVTLNADLLDGIDSTGFVQPGAGNEASLPLQFIVTDVLPSAGTKGRIAFKTPFTMP